MPSSLSVSTQCRIVSQSDALPIRTATSDFVFGIGMDGKLTASPTDCHGSLYSVGEPFAPAQNLPFHCRSSTAYCIVSSAKSIVLIGFMGTGKSSVGRILEKQTG